MSVARVLYVPNEAGADRQFGVRRALGDLARSGLISELSIFSLQWRIRNGGDPERHRRDLIARVGAFKPDVILMQHLGATGMKDEHFATMRTRSDFSLLYHEGDPYTRHLHPLPNAARAAGRWADVVFTVGAGVFSENFRRAGAKDVRWVPSAVDLGRFQNEPSTSAPRKFDVVVVANRATSRIRHLPNARDRIQFVNRLQSRFGDRLGLFGRGWEGVGVQGPVAYSDQRAALRSAWVSANWDHFASEPKYFSDRLPISLAAGSVHATSRHPGYNEVFAEKTGRFLLTSETQSGLIDSIAKYLTDTTPEERIAREPLAADFAMKNFRQDNQVVEFLNSSGRSPIDPNQAARAWDVGGVVPEDL